MALDGKFQEQVFLIEPLTPLTHTLSIFRPPPFCKVKYLFMVYSAFILLFKSFAKLGNLASLAKLLALMPAFSQQTVDGSIVHHSEFKINLSIDFAHRLAKPTIPTRPHCGLCLYRDIQTCHELYNSLETSPNPAGRIHPMGVPGRLYKLQRSQFACITSQILPGTNIRTYMYDTHALKTCIGLATGSVAR